MQNFGHYQPDRGSGGGYGENKELFGCSSDSGFCWAGVLAGGRNQEDLAEADAGDFATDEENAAQDAKRGYREG